MNYSTEKPPVILNTRSYMISFLSIFRKIYPEDNKLISIMNNLFYSKTFYFSQLILNYLSSSSKIAKLFFELKKITAV